MVVWETKCASCHGYFGESNEVFNPIVGGTSKGDRESGRVARLNDTGFPQRTTLMKLSNLSTLWDYINRAMPWNAPKSLSVEEVYAVTAYILNLGGIVDESFTLTNKNMTQAQALIPNRNGMSTSHGLWPGKEFVRTAFKPDVNAKRCMTDCAGPATVQSSLPDYARDAHGNLFDQNRLIGPQRGAVTVAQTAQDSPKPAPATPAPAAPAPAAPTPASPPDTPPSGSAPIAVDFQKILDKNYCMGCHQLDGKLLGPSFKEVSAKYSKQEGGQAYLVNKIRKGGVGVWGAIPMPEQAIGEADALALARWLIESNR